MNTQRNDEHAKHAPNVINLVRKAGVTGISETLLIQQLRGSGIRLSTLHNILRESTNIETRTERVRRSGEWKDITVYTYVLQGAESDAETSAPMARIVGTIHPDRAPERLSDAHRTELEHQPSATLPPTNRGRPPIPPVVFKGSGYDTPENLMEWWEE